jgi:glycosyltransferase involved in cell wall biosynthesis
VLHVINTLSAGGAELHLLTLCRYLQQRRVEVQVAYLRENVKGSRSLRADFEREGIRLKALGGAGRFSPRGIFSLRAVLREEPVDILHSHLPRGDLTAFLGRRGRLPWVCSVHDIYSESWVGRRALGAWGAIWRRAHAVVAISGAVRDWLVIAHRVRSERIRVIHYGIETEKWQSCATDLRAQWGLAGCRVIGAMGRLEPRKGFDLLLRAMPELVKRVPDVRLCLAGHDPWGYGETLRRMADELGLADYVRFAGFQSDVASFLHALDVFVFPTRSEGFGQVAIEAMAAQKPVVANRVVALEEIVVEGETGFLVNAEDAIEFASAIARLLLDPERATRMGAAGARRVHEYFNAAHMAEETHRLYEDICGKRPPGSASLSDD